MRVVFMGSPKFSVPSLMAISSHYDLVGVFTQPDRPAGRGRKVQASAVKTASLEFEIPIFQPPRVRTEDAVSQLHQLAPDLIIVVAYGQILSQSILDIPKFGSINVHASLLPRWRGAAPIQASILNGDSVTGITIMLMDAGMDTGPVLTQKSLEIFPDETSGELSDRLSLVGADLLIESLPGYLDGEILPRAQDNKDATYAPMIQKSEGLLDFNKSADELVRQIRAFEPWPTSFLTWKDRRIVVKQAHSALNDNTNIGFVIQENSLPAVVTGNGILVLDQVQPAGKKTMLGDAFLRGSPSIIGACIL